LKLRLMPLLLVRAALRRPIPYSIVTVMGKQTKVEDASVKLTGPAIILVEPQLGENIGAAARAMANFGLSDLRLVAPRDGWPNESAIASAAGAHAVITSAQIFATVEEAIGDLHYLCATTARPRDLVKTVLTPEGAVSEMDQRTRSGQRCGVLFGPEKSGLTNDHIALCDTIVTAPVDPAFASLNLAQSVLLIAYEWLKIAPRHSLGRETEFDGPAQEGLQMRGNRPATRNELIGFFDHLEQELDKVGFLRPPEKRPGMVRNLRNLFHRLGATDQDVRTLRGVVSALTRTRRSGTRDDAS
jgi:tRNA/rRNA methyltransferase